MRVGAQEHRRQGELGERVSLAPTHRALLPTLGGSGFQKICVDRVIGGGLTPACLLWLSGTSQDSTYRDLSSVMMAGFDFRRVERTNANNAERGQNLGQATFKPVCIILLLLLAEEDNDGGTTHLRSECSVLYLTCSLLRHPLSRKYHGHVSGTR